MVRTIGQRHLGPRFDNVFVINTTSVFLLVILLHNSLELFAVLQHKDPSNDATTFPIELFCEWACKLKLSRFCEK